MNWSYRSVSDQPGVYDLRYTDRVVARLSWVHLPQHPSLTMMRLVARLNLPAAECAPCPCPVWEWAPITTPDGSPREFVGRPIGDTRDGVWLKWLMVSSRQDEWMQRLLDGLNPGRNLPPVIVGSHAGAWS